MQSTVAAITLAGPNSSFGRICRQIYGHIRFRPYFKNLNPIHLYSWVWKLLLQPSRDTDTLNDNVFVWTRVLYTVIPQCFVTGHFRCKRWTAWISIWINQYIFHTTTRRMHTSWKANGRKMAYVGALIYRRIHRSWRVPVQLRQWQVGVAASKG